MRGTAARASDALRSRDFRRLFAIRLVSQSADGQFQAVLVNSVVFSPEEQSTTVGFAIVTLIVSLPFSILGPFTGVFIDRWSRRRILVIVPLLRTAAVWLVLYEPTEAAVPFYLGALWVLSVNRFYLATAVAVVPRLVPTRDLLVANSISIVGGTVALLAGVFVGGRLVDAFDDDTIVVILAGGQWLVAAAIASRIASSLRPHRVPTAAARDDLRRVLREFLDGGSRLLHTPRALGPIVSITLDQVGQGIALVLSLFFFRERFDEGIASFSNLIGAGGLGVLTGILTVGALEEQIGRASCRERV
jgi:MFS family permease